MPGHHHGEASWLDYFGDGVQAPTPAPRFVPFSPAEDPWCDLTFVRCIVNDDAQVPAQHEEPSASGEDYESLQLKELERVKEEEQEAKREERRRRKQALRADPTVVMHRQKKKSRTMRRRRLTREWKAAREYAAQYGGGTHSRIFDPAGHDERMLMHALPENWLAMYWLLSFVDDNIDHKLCMVDRRKEVFWPAEQCSKRTLGYELLQFMPADPLRRWNSLHALDRERTCAVATARSDAFELRRSKSESDLSEEHCSRWNPMRGECLETVEDFLDVYLQLVDCERQDQCDQLGDDFCFTF